MKGFWVDYGYMGWIPTQNKYKLFVSDNEYAEYYREQEEQED